MGRTSALVLRFLAGGIVVFSVAGCSWLINLAGGADASKTFQIPKATQQIAKCVTSSSYPASCPAVDADVSTQPLSTAFDAGWITIPAHPVADVNGDIAKRAIAAQAAINILNDGKVQKKINALFNLAVYGVPLSGADIHDAKAASTVNFDIDELDAYMSDLETATANGSWDALAEAANDPTTRDAKIPSAAVRQVTFIRNYLKAYFRDGHFLAVTVDATAIQNKLQSKVAADFPGLSASDTQSASTYLFKESGFEDGKKTIGNIGTTAFVTRGGQSYQFPAVQGSYTLGEGRGKWSSVSYVSVGADILRVILSAVFDAHMGIPAVPNATGALMGSAFDLPKYDQKVYRVTPENFEEIETRANEVEAVSGAAIGRVVRGIGWISLNNEGIATLVETITSVSLRKETEKVLWCWYECGATSSKADYAARDWSATKTITVTLTGLKDRTKLSGTAVNK